MLSCYEAVDGTLYHLHPEFVDATHDASNPSMLFCDRCKTQVGAGKSKAPPLSLAAGIDFGVLSRITEFRDPDMQLSEAEQMLLSEVRLYHIVAKARRDLSRCPRSESDTRAAAPFIAAGFTAVVYALRRRYRSRLARSRSCETP